MVFSAHYIKHMKNFIYLLMLALCAACNSSTTVSTTADSTTAGTAATTPASTECYAYITDADTVRLTMTLSGNAVTGGLVYRLDQKDSNTGTVRGSMHGDTLKGSYVFMSEGTESEREVRFLKTGNRLVEGVGDMEELNGKMVYKNPNTVRFTGGLDLVKIDCTTP